MTTEAQPKPDALAKVEIIPDDGTGHERSVVRGKGGKFEKRHLEATQRNMREGIKFLEAPAPDKPELSRAERLREKLYEVALTADADQLIGMVKAVKQLEDSALGSKSKDNLLNTQDSGGVKIIIINQDYGLAPPLSEEEQAKRDAPKLKPTFAEVIEVQTNPVDPTVNFRQRGERPAPGEPSDNSVADHIAKAQERFSR